MIGNMRTTGDCVSIRTDTEKLYNIFLLRYQHLVKQIFFDLESFGEPNGSGFARRDISQIWESWLFNLEGIEKIVKFSKYSESINYLLEEINKPDWNSLVIRDPSNTGSFIIIDRELADKALVLGFLP